MKNNFIKLKKIIYLSLMGMMLTGCNQEGDVLDERVVVADTSYEDMQNVFAPGEHMISIPLPTDVDVRLDNTQIVGHPGYKPIGICVQAYGKIVNEYAGGAILYINTEEVICDVTGKNCNDEALYTTFGTPTTKHEPSKKHTFDTYQHIIAVPLNIQVSEEAAQYPIYEGYELVGISSSAYGAVASSYGGGCLLYVNAVPVEVTPSYDKDGNAYYITFGTPIDEKKLTIK